VGRFKGNDEEDEWPRLALCSSHQDIKRKTKQEVFLVEANID
jgi:hypothetical protein